jgi:hypothetical protein
MRRRELLPAILAFFFVAAPALDATGQARAADGNTFIIAAAEGYGVEDCLAEGGECGRVVADAWCEAHGHGAAISFGLASDITNAIPGGGASHAASLPYVVRCGE